MEAALGLLGTLLVLLILGGIGYGLFLLARRLFAHATPSTTANSTSPALSAALPGAGLKNSLTFRTILVAVLGILMLIPLGLVGDLVRERHYLYQDVLRDIAGSWGERQELRGPLVAIPFVEKHITKEEVKDKDGNVSTKTRVHYTNRHLLVLPNSLNMDVSIAEEYRYRGIYESLVYTAAVRLKGEFTRPDVSKFSDRLHKVHWDKAFLSVGLSDTRAISEAPPLQWNEQFKNFSPGARVNIPGGSRNNQGVFNRGFHAMLDLSADGPKTFRYAMALEVNGSDGFYFAPFGETTTAYVHSSWPHPSFQGSILPTKHLVHEKGFNANWEIPHLARNYPQAWVMEDKRYSGDQFFTTGVQLFQPVFLYSLMERAVKYGALFIALTFMTFLIFELTVKARLHYVQYGLIGLALALFYLSLLSLAEHMVFIRAYIISSAVAVGMISLYTAAALRSLKRALTIFVLLSGLYVLLYSLLQLEDYALLMGTGLLLVVIMVLMYVTRNIREAGNQNE